MSLSAPTVTREVRFRNQQKGHSDVRYECEKWELSVWICHDHGGSRKQTRWRMPLRHVSKVGRRTFDGRGLWNGRLD